MHLIVNWWFLKQLKTMQQRVTSFSKIILVSGASSRSRSEALFPGIYSCHSSVSVLILTFLTSVLNHSSTKPHNVWNFFFQVCNSYFKYSVPVHSLLGAWMLVKCCPYCCTVFVWLWVSLPVIVYSLKVVKGWNYP